MKRIISTSWGFIIIFGATVILFGGALTYYYRTAPTTYDYMVQDFTVAKKASVDVTKDWKTYNITKLGLSFKYPKEWGDAAIDNGKVKVEEGYSYNIRFSGTPKVLAGFTSTDMVAGREGRFYEMININKNVSKITNCSSFKTNMGQESLVKCTDVMLGGKVVGMVTTYDFPEETMFGGPYTMAYYSTGNAQFPYVGFETDQKSANISVNFENIIKSFSKIASTLPGNTPAVTNDADASAWKAYTNSTYGFGLTFTDPWKGYKIREVNLEGTAKTFYINVPTTDPNYASETSTAFAGYVAPFAISVVNKSEWQDDEIFARDFGSKIGEKGDYVFTSSSWQACPSDLCDGEIPNSIKAVIASFQTL